MADERLSNRRQFLGAVGALSTATGTARASLRKPFAHETDFDVIVVGGGFSGTVAARDCNKSGLRTLLLEARPRLGGRTLSTLWNGHHVELGGTWVHWMQPGVWSEIHRYGLGITQTPGSVPERFIVRGDDFSVDEPAEKVAEEIARGGDIFFDNARTLWEQPWDPELHREILVANDSVTTLDRLKQVRLTPLQYHVVPTFVAGLAHNAIELGSYLEMARVYALGGYDWSLFNDVLARFQLSDGTGELIRRIAGDGRMEIRLATPVTSIEQRNDLVLVRSKTISYSGKAVILAVPMNCLANIECVPSLSPAKLAASRERHAGSGFKFFAEIKGRMGKVSMIGSQGAIDYAFTYAELPTSTLIVGFGNDASSFDANDPATVQRALRRLLPDAQVVACTGYPWVTDPYSLGTWCTYRPGRVVEWQDALAAREGRIFMAGSDVAKGSRGFIDGAITRGTRVALEVTIALAS